MKKAGVFTIEPRQCIPLKAKFTISLLFIVLRKGTTCLQYTILCERSLVIFLLRLQRKALLIISKRFVSNLTKKNK